MGPSHSDLENLITPLQPAKISWIGSMTPFNEETQDIYFSVDEGVQEAHHTFIKGNHLGERFLELTKSSDYFVIGELGFGTGLNFLVTADYFLKTCTQGRLVYISVEKSPIFLADLKQMYELLKEQISDNLLSEMLLQWPGAIPGFHTMILAGGRVELRLLHGDGVSVLKELSGTIDAWYLDGFSPKKNPDLWSEAIFKEIKHHSRRGTTFATYSVSSQVKQGLSAVGFQIERVVGFGRKKHALRGQFEGEGGGEKKTASAQTFQIVGAGLAGVELAAILKRKGHSVVLIDSPFLGAGSLNPLAVAMPSFAKQFHPSHAITALAFHHAVRAHRVHRVSLGQASNDIYGSEGILKLARPEEDIQSLKKALSWLPIAGDSYQFLTREETSTWTNQYYEEEALWLKDVFTVRVPKYLALKLDSLKIPIETHTKLDLSLRTVFCNGSALSDFYGGYLTKLRGQVVSFTTPKGPFDRSLARESYLSSFKQKTYVGATYERGFMEHEVDISKRQSLWQRFLPLSSAFPDFESEEISSWVGFRTTTRDYLPVVGGEDERVSYERGFKSQTYALGGFGSKGLNYSSYCAEALSCELTGEPISIPQSVSRKIKASRFLDIMSFVK